jgi:hypothetical protein
MARTTLLLLTVDIIIKRCYVTFRLLKWRLHAMIICFNCGAQTKQYLDRMLADRQYKDYAEIIEVAIANLMVLTREIQQKGSIIIEADGEAPTSQRGQLVNTAERETKRGQASAGVRVSQLGAAGSVPGMAEEGVVPKLFTRPDNCEAPPNLPSVPDDPLASDVQTTLDRWLFGQYNKLLPLKVNCRALAWLVSSHTSGIPLEIATRDIAAAAARLGDYLEKQDFLSSNTRYERLATAFPRTGPSREKSLLRYGNQFIGTVDGHGALLGLPFAYRMVQLAPGDSSRIVLTQAGWQFACMANKVLDELQGSSRLRFSNEETDFLINHIRRCIPIEHFAFRQIITAIGERANTPERLAEALGHLVPPESAGSLSPSFLASQHSGAISRMTDLGLVTRYQNGLWVSYKVTDAGREFVAKVL